MPYIQHPEDIYRNVPHSQATGNLGTLILTTLLRSNALTMTVLVRLTSAPTTFPDSVIVKPVDHSSGLSVRTNGSGMMP